MGARELAERVCDLRTWANSRIESCRKLEQKFTYEHALGSRPASEIPPGALQASAERCALEAVLRILNGDY
jgi:hypothetical protein